MNDILKEKKKDDEFARYVFLKYGIDIEDKRPLGEILKGKRDDNIKKWQELLNRQPKDSSGV